MIELIETKNLDGHWFDVLYHHNQEVTLMTRLNPKMTHRCMVETVCLLAVHLHLENWYDSTTGVIYNSHTTHPIKRTE